MGVGAALGLAAFLLLVAAETVRMRRRIASLGVLSPESERAPPDTLPITIDSQDASGVDAALRHRLADYFRRRSIVAADLVPANLDTESALEFLAARDPEIDRKTIGHGVGAGVATAQIADAASHDLPSGEVKTACELLDEFARLRNEYGVRARNVVVPGMSAPPVPFFSRHGLTRRRLGLAWIGHGVVQTLIVVWIVALWIASPLAGAFATGAFHLQPLFIFHRTAFAPRDRMLHTLFRFPRYVAMVVAYIFGKDWERAARTAEARERYRELAPKVGSFMGPRRNHCPWCGGSDLTSAVQMGDIVQHKPGRFNLDRCGGCRTVFQNPALTPDGLSFYYLDCYDGHNGAEVDQVFAASEDPYRDRMRSIRPVLPREPERWLDVGGGYGHFCAVARRELPITDFEVLDLGATAEQSVCRGWASRAWVGKLAAFVGEMRGHYDVVSLFHVLEHTPTPQTDLRNAAEALSPGGALVIEVPNPECVWGKILGRFWLPWFQPQHLQLIPSQTLVHYLFRIGLDVSKVEYISTAGDCFTALAVAIRSLAPGKDLPWRSARPRFYAWIDWALWIASVPLFLCALAVDSLWAKLPARASTRNAYRVVALRRAAQSVPGEYAA